MKKYKVAGAAKTPVFLVFRDKQRRPAHFEQKKMNKTYKKELTFKVL